MDESREAPHAIENSRKVYVRTGDLAYTVIDIADIQTVDRLLTRRRGVLARRQQLNTEGEDLVRKYAPGAIRHEPWLSVIVTPLYPVAPLSERNKIYDFLLRVPGFAGRVYRYPDGACAINPPSPTRPGIRFWKVSMFGHIYAVDALEWSDGDALGSHALAGEKVVYPFSWIVHHLHRVLPQAGNLYKLLQFKGDTQVEACLRNVNDSIFAGGETFLAKKLASIAKDVPASSVCAPSELWSFGLLTSIFYQLLWPFLSHEDEVTEDTAGLYVQRILNGRW